MGRTKFWLMVMVLTVASSTANATLMLSLDDNAGNTLTASELFPGYLDFNGSVGAWNFNDVTAFSNPIIGDDYIEAIHLDSVNVTSGAGTLTLMLTQTDMTKSPAPIMAGFGGYAAGNISFALYADSLNTAFGTDTNTSAVKLYESSTFGSGSFSNDFASEVIFTDPYTLTMVVNITHTKKSATSFNYDVKVPEPATLGLMGLGLLAFGFLGRRARNINL